MCTSWTLTYSLFSCIHNLLPPECSGFTFYFLILGKLCLYVIGGKNMCLDSFITEYFVCIVPGHQIIIFDNFFSFILVLAIVEYVLDLFVIYTNVLFCTFNFRSFLKAAGIAQIAPVGYVVILSTTKRLQVLMMDLNVHSVSINVSFLF